jgi:hypothetical protein
MNHKNHEGTRKKSSMNQIAALAGWANFFEIVGTSAGALIGLQFVVMALVANVASSAGPQQQKQAGDAFATPTIVHFGTVLLLSAVLSAPWRGIVGPVIVVTAIGLCGLMYTLVVTRRMRRQTAYQPVFEDWLFHCLLPLAAYAVLAASAYEARLHAHGSIFGVGAGALVLLFTGIHNAWDAASYHVFVARHRRGDPTD